MIQWILRSIICHVFEQRVEKGWRMRPDRDSMKDPVPTMHIAWEISPHEKGERGEDGEQLFQYKRVHMLICGPCNYVYVAIQEEVIDMDGEQSFGPLQVIGHHDSCWRDAVDRFIHENSHRLSMARSSENLFGWHDVYELSIPEVEYLSAVENWRRNKWGKDEVMPQELVDQNPIQARWVR